MTSTGATIPRKTQRQLAASATKPARAGPMSPGTTHALETSAIILGRVAGA